MSPEALPDFTQVRMVGRIVLWVTAVIVLAFFLHLPRFGAHRRLLRLWVAAWAALVVSTLQPAIAAISQLVKRSLLPMEAGFALDLVVVPARLLFLLFVVLAALQASGRSLRMNVVQALVAGVTLLGLALSVTNNFNFVNQSSAVIAPLLFLGAAFLLMMAREHRRMSGVTSLAVAMALFAVGTTLFTLGSAGAFSKLMGPGVARYLLATESYGSAFLVAMLGAAVVVLVVQESLLLVDETRAAQLRASSEAEERLRRIIDTAGDALITFDGERKIALANEAAGQLFRLPPSSLVGRPLAQLLGTIDTTQTGNGVPTSGTMVGRRPDGSTFPAEVTIGAFAEGTSTSGGVMIVRDLTAQEAERLEHEQFERHVAASEKMLAIGRVVSGVAHELNNPLMVVLSQSEQLSAVSHDTETDVGIRMIREQALRARYIVRDLLSFVRPAPRVPTTMDMVALVHDVMSAQRGRTEGHGVQVDLDLPSEPVVVRSDRLGMEQVLTNLVENATDAAGVGGRVTVRVRRSSSQGVLVVEDSGPGVPDELALKIFEPFFTTKGVGKGTGLGLAVSQGLVERLGGVLRLENRPAAGIGARFVVEFSLISTAELPEALPFPELPPSTPAAVLGEGGVPLPVMIIDDDPAVRRTIRAIFERWKWPVLEFDRASEALGYISRGGGSVDRVALIVCDIRMPEMSGQSLFEAVGRVAPTLQHSFVFVTGDAVEEETSAFLTRSGQPVVEKPFTLAEFGRTVQDLLERIQSHKR